MTETLLTKREAAVRLRWHPEHLMREARAGRFPKPIKTGTSSNSGVRFVESEVAGFVAARMAARPIWQHQCSVPGAIAPPIYTFSRVWVVVS